MSKLGAQKSRERRAASAGLPAPKAPTAEVGGDAPLLGRQAPLANLRRFTPGAQGDLQFSQVQSILRDQEQGYCRTWVDLCRRILSSDDQAWCVYETRNAPVAGAKRAIEAAAAPPGWEASAARQADDCMALLESLHSIERTFSEMLDGDWIGFAVHEIIWEPRADMVWPAALEWLNQRRFRWSDRMELFLWDDGSAVERARELGIPASSDVCGLPLSTNKYVVHVPRLLTDYPTRSGLLNTFVRPWWVKNWALRFWLSGAEFAGNPRLLGKVPQAAADVVAQELYNVLSNIAADQIGVIREGTSIDVLGITAQGTGGVWESLIKLCNAAMSKAGIGSTLNVEIGDTGGAYAAAESQADMTIRPRAERSARMLANTIEQQLFAPFLRFNSHRYGGRVFVPKLVLTPYANPTDAAAAVAAGARVTHDEVRAQFNLQPLGRERGGDEYIAPQAPAPFAADIAGGYGLESAETDYKPVKIPDGTVEAAAASPFRSLTRTRMSSR